MRHVVLLAGLLAAATPTAASADACGVDPTLTGMVRIPGGSFTMGEDEAQPEERSAHPVTVSGFWIDRYEVTNTAFARFVAATGYRTLAERGLDPKAHPELPPELLAPGAMVFSKPEQLDDPWWRFKVEGHFWGSISCCDGVAGRPAPPRQPRQGRRRGG